MTNLKNVTVNYFPASTLYMEETDLLLAVARRFIDRYPILIQNELKGSCCIVGQRGDEYPEEILRFDFPGGSYVNHANLDSVQLVAAGVEHALYNDNFTLYTPHNKNAANTLTLRTKYGRFIISVYLSPKSDMRHFLIDMACAIKEMGYANPADKSLEFSFSSLNLHQEERILLSRLESEIWGNAFSSPEMIAWRLWHNNHTRFKGDFGFFFEKPQEIKEETA